MPTSSAQCAQTVLDVVPAVMRVLRAEMRRHRAPALTVPQFRALVWIEGQPGTSVSQVAEHVGLTRPSASVLVEALVRRRLVTRRPHPTDRRRVTLDLTAGGLAVVQASRERTLAFLAERLGALSDAQRAQVTEALIGLRQSVLAPADES